ncbi:DUF3726 domain-containing protein [bacterium]|jgi:hypothetical protein|nr:DUF3726 domain-containing protein [Pelagibacterales bacterium]MDA9685285.1 DUF3726 domain-containing protein [bacterium]|tara:strand:- start:1100 stop:1714 length:615 start_codon:yes stop_codon:yes gene_type:complete
MRTSSEIETISKRATKAAGFPWGIAEEVGKNIKSLELLSISGIENLSLYLEQVKGKETFGPKEISIENNIKPNSFCPFYTGSALLDSASKVEEIKNLTLHSINFPILLIPFINRLSDRIGKKIKLQIDDHNFLLNLNKFIATDTNLMGLIIENAKIIKIEIQENEDSFKDKVWDQLYELSTETFVEETDRLKENAAGAGLADND